MLSWAITRLLEGYDLTRAEARDVMGTIMRGEATPAQIGGFLIALRAKGETADEITGCAEAMRAQVLAVRPRRNRKPSRPHRKRPTARAARSREAASPSGSARPRPNGRGTA